MAEHTNRRLLYVASTQLQLVSCLVLQMTENAGIPADVILMDSSDWSLVRPNLLSTGLIEHMDDLKLYRSVLDGIRDRTTYDEKVLFVREMIKSVQLPHLLPYTDMYINMDSNHMKVLYYALAEHGITPDVHLIEEATATYTRSVIEPLQDYVNHRKYRKNGFYRKIRDLYLFEPSCYTGGNADIPLRSLQKINTLTQAQKNTLCSLYPVTPQIEEKVIFFEGVFYGDMHLCDEYDLFTKIVERVGKENVVVKRHPRVQRDRYTEMGVKVLPNSTVPWEFMLLSQDLTGKLLISLASFTCMSPLTIYGMKYRAMFLNNLKTGFPAFLEDKAYVAFINHVEKQLNRERQNLWNPKTLKEMYLQLDHYMIEEDIVRE